MRTLVLLAVLALAIVPGPASAAGVADGGVAATDGAIKICIRDSSIQIPCQDDSGTGVLSVTQ